MKKRNMLIGYFALFILMATFVACASTSSQPHSASALCSFSSTIPYWIWDDETAALCLDGRERHYRLFRKDPKGPLVNFRDG